MLPFRRADSETHVLNRKAVGPEQLEVRGLPARRDMEGWLIYVRLDGGISPRNECDNSPAMREAGRTKISKKKSPTPVLAQLVCPLRGNG